MARSIGNPAVCGAEQVTVDVDARRFRVGDVTVPEGDVISLDGTTGEVVVGEVDVVEASPDEAFHRLLGWADGVRRLGVRANADTAEGATTARELGAEGVGLCRTEHMFLGDRLPLVRRVILAPDSDSDAERDALAELEAEQRADFAALLEAMDGLPVTVRLLDPPLHEFLPDLDELIAGEATGEFDDDDRALLAAARDWREDNPMLGTRGVRLRVAKPELYRMQVRALTAAAMRRRREGGDPKVEVMVPLVVARAELALVAGWVREAAEATTDGQELPLEIGTMDRDPPGGDHRSGDRRRRDLLLLRHQ